VGDYETMYRRCADPWRIEELGLRLDMRAALLLVDEALSSGGGAAGQALSVLDAGCGAGLLSTELARLLIRQNPGSVLTLADISPTAVRLAEERLAKFLAETRKDNNDPKDEDKNKPKDKNEPNDLIVRGLSFDLRKLGDPALPLPDGGFSLILAAQVLWGLIENLDGLFPSLRQKLVPGGSLVMSQHFPEPSRQSYAPEVDASAVAALAAKAGFELVHTLETDRGLNSHWAALWTCV
jgi:SAM-dependent methyltransferase